MNPEPTAAPLTGPRALALVRAIAADTNNIIVVGHGKQRQQQRHVTRRQIELCVQRGTIVEGPFVNGHGHWQVTMFRHAAGEELHCVVAIELPAKLIIVTVY